MNSKTLQFILTHAEVNPLDLTLQSHRYPGVDMAVAVRQIAARQRIRTKLPEFYKIDRLLYPVQLSLEQCSSEQTAKHKATLVKGKIFIDLTGGFGVDFYYLAQNFEQSIYVEKQEELCKLADHNFRFLELKDFQVVNQTAIQFISTMPLVDLIYIDPHRRDSTGHKTVQISDCEPDLTQILPDLVSKSKTLMVKLSPMLDLHRAIADLPGTFQIDIVAVENECKELIFLISSDKVSDKHLKIRCFNYMKNKIIQQFETISLHDSENVYYTLNPLEFLYEPNVALLKSGAFNTIANYYKLQKFNPNTHLYTSAEYISDFPGRVFKVIETLAFNKQVNKYLQQKYTRANISVRNFTMSVDELRSKTKLLDGGEWYLFAFKNADNKNILSICKKP
jgi:hypothetical protein